MEDTKQNPAEENTPKKDDKSLDKALLLAQAILQANKK